MATTNAYPEKPVVPYEKTTCTMSDAIAIIKALPYSLEIKRATYVL